MVRALAVSDEEVSFLTTERAAAFGVDLVIAAGDLSFEYLGALIDFVDRPGVFVPGNHDPSLSRFSKHFSWSLRAGMPKAGPGSAGFVNADGRVVDIGGLRVAGLGGCLRYRPGPNQWSELEQARRGRRLVRSARRLRTRDGRDVDILLTHAPPRHCGDREDQPHRGFECLHDVVAALQPRLLVHGHIHPYGQPVPDRLLGETTVVNVVGHRELVLEVLADIENTNPAGTTR
jgi:Icc-related predicted phosphoesterase